MKRLIVFVLLLLWSAADVRAQSSYVTRSDLAISSDSRLAYGVGADGVLNEIRISDGSIVNRFDLNISEPVFGIGLNEDDSIIGVGTRSGRIVVFDLTEIRITASYRLLNSTIYEVKIIEDRLIASGGSGPIYEVKLTTGNIIKEYDKGNASNEGMGISSDGRYILVGNHDGTIQYFNRITGVKEFELNNPFVNTNNNCRDLISAKISPDGKLGAVTGCGGRAIIIDLDNEQILKSIQADPYFSTDISFSADNKKIAISNLRGTIKVFDIQSENELLVIPDVKSNGLQFFVSYSPSGDYILSSGPNFPLRIFSTVNGSLVKEIPKVSP